MFLPTNTKSNDLSPSRYIFTRLPVSTVFKKNYLDTFKMYYYIVKVEISRLLHY
jgi:hypothetical protein